LANSGWKASEMTPESVVNAYSACSGFFRLNTWMMPPACFWKL